MTILTQKWTHFIQDNNTKHKVIYMYMYMELSEQQKTQNNKDNGAGDVREREGKQIGGGESGG